MIAGRGLAVRTHQAVDASPLQPPPHGGRSSLVLEEVIVTNNAAGAYTDVTGDFRIEIPSVRLHVSVTLGFRPTTAETAAVPGFSATLDAWVRTQKGFFIASNSIVPGANGLPTALPYTYEAITAVKQWRGVLTVPNAPGTGVVPGQLYVVATFEPAAGSNIPPAELEKIFEACKLQVPHGLTTSTTGV